MTYNLLSLGPSQIEITHVEYYLKLLVKTLNYNFDLFRSEFKGQTQVNDLLGQGQQHTQL